MGTIIKVKNANYSANAVGKYDFENDIFRPYRTDNTLQKNAVYFNPYRMLGNENIQIDAFNGKQMSIKLFFKYKARTSEIQRLFSFSSNNIAFVIDINTSGKIVLQIQNYNNGSNSIFTTTNNVISDVTLNVDNRLIGTDTKLAIELKYINGGYSYGLCTINGVDLTGTKTNGSITVKTIPSFVKINGDTFASLGTYTTLPGVSNVWFASVLNDGLSQLHFDFVGKDESEILTDKTTGVKLNKYGAFFTLNDNCLVEVGD